MSELTKRILVAVPAAAFFIYVTWLGGWYLKVPLMLAGVVVINETIHLFEMSTQSPNRYFPYTIGLWILLVPNLPHPFQIGLIILLLFMLLQLPKPTTENVRTLGSTLFSGLYAPLGLLTFLEIRLNIGGEHGFILTLALMLMVWGNDVFAYFGGKMLGKNKMAPKISPKKTWEGFGFGFLGAFVGFSIPAFFIPMPFPLTLAQGILPVILVSIFGPAGDLAISKLKRASHVKDASNLLPGHGGLLDRFDALILAAPAFYLYLYGLQTYGYATF